MEFELYTVLRLIWWLVLGILLIGFAIMDGFDLGVASMLPYVGRNDVERRVVINTIGPVWEGNQVWLLLGGGAIFAAFAPLYGLSFSGFYPAMLLILFALILRPVGFKFRSKVENTKWRNTWDTALFIGGFVPALVCGVAVGNVILGVPFAVDPTDPATVLYNHSQGHLFYLLFNPNGFFVFTLLTGLVSVGMCLMQGGNYLALKTEGQISQRAATAGRFGGLMALVLFLLCGLLVAVAIKGYTLLNEADVRSWPSQQFNLLEVEHKTGAWMDNFTKYPFFIIAPALAIGGMLLSYIFNRAQAFGKAFMASSLGIFGIVSTAGTAIFPFLLPSSTNPEASLLVWNASNSQKTLLTMTIFAVIFVPIILAYTAWVYNVLRGTITENDVVSDGQSY